MKNIIRYKILFLVIFFTLIIKFASANSGGSIFCKVEDIFLSNHYKSDNLNLDGDIDYSIKFLEDVFDDFFNQQTEDEKIGFELLKNAKDQILFRYSSLLTILDDSYSPIKGWVHNLPKDIIGLYELENIYLNKKTKKLVARNNYCDLQIKENIAYLSCKAYNVNDLYNETLFAKFTCNWN